MKPLLSQHLRDTLYSRIVSGQYAPGSRIDSIRKLSEEFGFSTRVVIQALELLERESVLSRVPAKGVFVSPDFNAEQDSRRLAFVFPRATISPDEMPPENWSQNCEIYRGVLYGAEQSHSRVSFVHMPDSDNELELHAQARRLSAYDGVIFVSPAYLPLARILTKRVPCILHSWKPIDGFATIGSMGPNRNVADLVDRLVNFCGYSTAGVFTAQSGTSKNLFFQERAAFFQQEGKRQGLEVSQQNCLFLPNETAADQLTAFMRQNPLPQVFFCNQIDNIIAIYEAAWRNGMQIGREVGLVAICSGLTLTSLVPSCTFLKIPHFEIGRRAAEILVQACRDNHLEPTHTAVRSIFVPSASTVRKQEKEVPHVK
mgnify:FL=1|jgi:GntR family transcriptional regulator